MAIMDNYRPVRIMKRLVVNAKSQDDLKAKFPHARKTDRIKFAARSLGTSGSYEVGQVIDNPSPEERVIFANMPGIAREIRQHKDGFDDPRCNIARSREASARGRQKYAREIALQKPAVANKVLEIKPEPEPIKEEPVIEPKRFTFKRKIENEIKEKDSDERYESE